MNDKKDGGPAFPRTQWTGSDKNSAHRDVAGMSLRDNFISNMHNEGVESDYAVELKEALLGREMPSYVNDPRGFFQFEAEFRATWKGIQADAMLAERDK